MEAEMQDSSIDLSLRRSSNMEEMRLFRDPIWDLMKFNKLACSFIDTPQFQRLRYLKQLGVTYLVFPGASHNRFEHSLGTAHLARKLIEHLRESQPDLNIDNRDIQCVELAGLCHDLGHGPFSHVFDIRFIPKVKPSKRWCHEEASEMMLDALIRESRIKIPKDWVEFIKDLIRGEPRLSRHHDPPEKPFLFEIVSNKTNGIDVDKWDYLARDSKMVGESCPLVATRLLEAARVVDGRIAYNWKDSHSVDALFYSRYFLHKKVYTHKTSRAIEHMILDAFIAAEPVYHMSESIDNPNEYLFLTDSILEEIERSKDPKLERSRRIIRDLRRRKIPHRVEEICIRVEYEDLWKERLTSAAVAVVAQELEESGAEGIVTPERAPNLISAIVKADTGCSVSPTDASHSHINEWASACEMDSMNEDESDLPQGPITENDIIIDFCVLHFGMKQQDPLESVPYYGKKNPNHWSSIQPHESSLTRPRSFQELIVRCYVRHKSQEAVIQTAFRRVLEKLPLIDDLRETTPKIAEVPSTPLLNRSAGSSFVASDVPATPGRARTMSLSKLTPHNSFMDAIGSLGSTAERKIGKRKNEDQENDVEPGSPLRKRSKN